MTFDVYDMGFKGICIATCIQFTCRFLVNLTVQEYFGGFTKFKHVKIFSKRTTIDLKGQATLGFYAMSMGVWGWWAFDIFTLIASYMSPEIIAA